MTQQKSVIVTLLLSLLFAADARAFDSSLRSCIDHYPPLKVVDGDTITGELVEVTKTIGNAMGLKVSFDVAPFDQCLKRLKLGSIDLLAGLLHTKERAQYIDLVPFTTEQPIKVFLTKDDGPLIERYEDLRGLKIAKMMGVRQFKRFDEDSKLDTVDVPHHESGIQMLRSGRVDAMVLLMSRAMDIEQAFANLKVQPYQENVNIQVYVGLSRAGLTEGQRKRLRDVIMKAEEAGLLEAAWRRFQLENPDYY